MNAALRRDVWLRAGSRCEYCLLRQEHEPNRRFHVEHILAISHGGPDDLRNLALACQLCNSLKGPNLSGIDPDTGKLQRLFNPRLDEWSAHFRMEEAMIVGLTAVGRTTTWLLGFNTRHRVALRRALIELDEWS